MTRTTPQEARGRRIFPNERARIRHITYRGFTFDDLDHLARSGGLRGLRARDFQGRFERGVDFIASSDLGKSGGPREAWKGVVALRVGCVLRGRRFRCGIGASAFERGCVYV